MERMFSKLKRVKINFPYYLGVECFDPSLAIKKLSTDKVRCTNVEKGPRSYKSCNSAEVNVKSLSDDDSYQEEENISENGDEEEYVFSSDFE